jgi:hypothetical protein
MLFRYNGSFLSFPCLLTQQLASLPIYLLHTAADGSEPMYSDEYIQSIYNTATSNKRQVSIADESVVPAPLAVVREQQTDVEDEDEEEPSSSSQRSSPISFHRPVPPAMMMPPRSSVVGGARPAVAAGMMQPQQQQQQRPPPFPTTKKIQSQSAMKKQPPPPPALKKTTMAASNTTMTTTNTASTTSNTTSTPPRPAAVVDRIPGKRTAAADDEEEPLPAATGPFAVPVPSKLKTAARPTPVARSSISNRIGGGGGGDSTGSGGWISAQTTMLAVFWNRVFRRYYAMKLIGMLLAIYTAVLSFTYTGTFGKYGGVVDPETGYIIDTNSEANTANGVIVMKGVERAVVAATSFELVALVIARLTAFYMYPGTVYHLMVYCLIPFISAY